VIPVFQKQKEKGSLTITDERMTRFWITLEQAAYFVLDCIEQMQGGEVFIPKIPSMRVVDLAHAIAPDCKVEYTGIRPGEKIHEVLVSKDEARQVLETEDKYIIEPAHPWWEQGNWEDAKQVPEGFEFTSDNNKDWLSEEDLKKLLREIE
jgi:UDP-N-acetylglucosamine 4,6-dehydratase